VKRWMWWLLIVAVISSFGFAQTCPVPANDEKPAGLPPRAWACYPTCVLPSYIVTDDFNVDGWLDLAVSCSGTSDVWIYGNQGTGIFNVPTAPPAPPAPAPSAIVLVPPIPSNPIALVTGQFVGAGNAMPGFDGWPDIGVLSGFTGQVRGIAGGAGLASPAALLPAPFAPIPGALHMAGGDFDYDGRLDFAVITAAGLYILQSSAGYVVPPILPRAGAVFVVTGDFDRNGWIDIAVLVNASPGYSIQVYRNNGGTFIPWALTPGVPNFLVPTGMDVGDFNADGYLDLVVIGNTTGVPARGFAQVFLNSVPVTGAVDGLIPQFPLAMSTWGFNSRFVTVLDADGNGRDDFAVANWGTDTVTIFLTDALPALVVDKRPVDPRYCLCDDQRKKDLLDIQFKLFKIELKCGHFPIGLAAGDFDHNGKMDLAVALQSSDKELCAQNPSCIEIDFDIACGFTSQQTPHGSLPGVSGESQQCPECKEEPCVENVPPKAEIQTESETKNQ